MRFLDNLAIGVIIVLFSSYLVLVTDSLIFSFLIAFVVVYSLLRLYQHWQRERLV